MSIALVILLFGIYLAIGIKVKRYTMRAYLLLLAVSGMLPALFYFLM